MRPLPRAGGRFVGLLAGLVVVSAAPRILAWTAPLPLPIPTARDDATQVPPRVLNGSPGANGRDSAGTETAGDVPHLPLPPPMLPTPPPTAATIQIAGPQTARSAGGNNGDVTAPDEDLDAAAPPPGSPLVITGYLDVGYAKAQGNGTSFRPGDTRVPADYGVDTFATAVNSRGEVASTDSGGLFTNGFLPRSVGIGGTPSFLINTANLDFRYTATEVPVLVFTRVQLLPRLEPTGDVTRVVMEQAFGRLTPLKGAELTISVGKFDSVFGIEYLDNQANFRVGITPSLAGPVHHRAIGRRQGILSLSDSLCLVGDQPQRGRDQQRNIRRGVAGTRSQPDRKSGPVGANRSGKECGEGFHQAGRERRVRAAQRSARQRRGASPLGTRLSDR